MDVESTERRWKIQNGLGIVILSVRPFLCLFVRPSVTRVLCDERKEHTAKILIPHERVITLVFSHENRLVGDVHFNLKFALKVTHPFEKRRLDQYLLITSQP